MARAVAAVNFAPGNFASGTIGSVLKSQHHNVLSSSSWDQLLIYKQKTFGGHVDLDFTVELHGRAL